jgi:hypothetical protein
MDELDTDDAREIELEEIRNDVRKVIEKLDRLIAGATVGA